MVVFKKRIHGESSNIEGKKKSHLRGQKGFSFIGRGTARCFYISKGVRRSPLQSSQCYQRYMFHVLQHREG